MSRTLVELDDVSVSYGGPPVLHDVAFTVEEGQFTGVVGPSGAGKTTLLRLLLRAIRPTKGSVVSARDLAIGYVPQLETINWSFPITVFECVMMSRLRGRILPWPSRSERKGVHEVLERLGISSLAGRHIRELSGGQQQRMFLARAMMSNPRLLLLDEPTSGVDISTRHEILHLLARLNKDGMAVVLTTHDLNGIAAHLPHIVCVNKRIIAEGTTRRVMTSQVLEETYGARLEVLEHLGMPLVIDEHRPQLTRSQGA